MIETLHTTLAFIVAISLLIGVHEYGHFLVARRLGVKVEKFSIGFGPSLFSWKSRDGEVTYVIAGIPLGGYVKMLGEVPGEEPIAPADRARAFDAQPVWKRAAIATAGPMFNFLFAIVAYVLVGWIGQQVLPPVIGAIAPASAAEQAGFLPGDRLLRIDDEQVHSWRQIEELLKTRVGKRVQLTWERGGSMLSATIQVPRPAKDPLLSNVVDEIGMGPGMRVIIADVVAGSPAAAAGLEAGDQVLQVEGRAVNSIAAFIHEVRSHAGQPMTLSVVRGETRLHLDVRPESDAEGNGRIGARMAAEPLLKPQLYRMSPLEGIAFGVQRTWQMTTLTLQIIGKMVARSISPESLGGPIAIAQLAGKTAGMGLSAFLSFLALISVNLAVLNLMPVPVLDGGHLVYLGIEKLRGRPLSPEMLERTQAVGVALIILLMVFAFYNDLQRLFRG